jgi:Uncharacterized protein conserved in bacteria (DUF2059)
MRRIAFILLTAAGIHTASAAVDIEAAAQIYQDTAMREQVRASLGSMPAHIRKLFEGNTSSPLTDDQLAAVAAAAKHGFRISVFETPALTALAANLDPLTVKKSDAFFLSDVGKRMVEADVALATLEESQIDKVMNGEITAPSTPERDTLFEKIERAERSTESTVDIFLNMGSSVALGTAVGSGMDPGPIQDRARKSGDASRASLEQDMHKPLLRYLAYGYRNLSDADLKQILAFLQSSTGKHFVAANIASMGAGFDAMGKRCGEQLGESFRELAQAQLATESATDATAPR